MLPGFLLHAHFYCKSLNGCVDGSVVKNGYCPFIGPKIGSQHPHQIAQTPVTVVVRDPVSPSGYPPTHTVHINTYT